MFVGFNDGYIDMVDSRLLYTVDTNIHHVESWGSIEACFINKEAGGRYGYPSETEVKEYQAKHDTDIDTIKDSDYYKKASVYGKNCQKNYVDWKWKNSMCFDILGVDSSNKAYDIKTKKGDLPFDFDGDGNVSPFFSIAYIV